MTLSSRLRRFFFAPVTASPWGLMRMAWAFTVFTYMLGQWQDVTRYYSDRGILPNALSHVFVRSQFRFTIFTGITDPKAVFFVYLILLLSCLCMLLGQWPRLMTVVSVLLLFSFHERNPMPLGGGDTVLRVLGLLLMIAPGIKAFSLPRLDSQWHFWKKNGALLQPLTMPRWPQVLLQWQLIVIYLTSAWDKMNGTMWWAGTAPAIAFHHPHFARFPGVIEDTLSLFSPLIAYATLLFELLWVALLIPPVISKKIPWVRSGKARRWLLIGGVLFHGGIFVFMDAGSFSWAMMTAFLGMLRDEDIAAIKAFWNRNWTRQTRRTKKRIDVLYDGRCGFCCRSVFWLAIMDWLGRLHLVNFHNAVARADAVPDLTFEQLNRSMHIRLPAVASEKTRDEEAKAGMPDGRTYVGFRAFRQIAHHLPPLWPLVPIAYLPGAASIGDRVYRRIADKRKKCNHQECMV